MRGLTRIKGPRAGGSHIIGTQTNDVGGGKSTPSFVHVITVEKPLGSKPL